MSGMWFDQWLKPIKKDWRPLKCGYGGDKVSNAEVLQKVQENKSILDTVQHRKFRWIGHILRHDSLLRDIIEGRMTGKVTRGRKRLQMLSDVISKSYEELERGWRQKLVEEKVVKPAIQGRKPKREHKYDLAELRNDISRVCMSSWVLSVSLLLVCVLFNWSVKCWVLFVRSEAKESEKKSFLGMIFSR